MMDKIDEWEINNEPLPEAVLNKLHAVFVTS